MFSHPRFRWLEDLYWCCIPLTCRSCDYLHSCRSSFWKGRKCINGCVKKQRKRAILRENDREDYIRNLVKYMEEREEP
jgi:hypothetical protein